MAKKRGPGYPGMSLPEALSRAKAVYEQEPHNSMSKGAIAQHLGYKGISGASMTTVADLRRYGIIEGRGDDIRLSNDALIIYADEDAEDQGDRHAALTRCAIHDPLFKDILQRFSTLPSEVNLAAYLVKQGFKKDNATEIASNYRKTMEFIGELKDEDAPAIQPNPSAPGMQPPAEQSPPPTGARDIHLPLGNDSWAILRAPFPLTPGSWEQMVRVLKAMKPGLVKGTADEQKGAEDLDDDEDPGDD